MSKQAMIILRLAEAVGGGGGGGGGGIASVNRAAMYGKKCALIEMGDIGGTCVNVGCVPKKVMWYSAQIAVCDS